MTAPARPYVSVGPQGRITRLPHDGRITVRGGTAPVYGDGGRRAGERTLARCVDCQSQYYWTGGDAYRTGRVGQRRCPACHRQRENARLRAYWHSHPEARRRSAEQSKRWAEAHPALKRAASREANRRRRAKLKDARPDRACQRCALPIPRHLSGKVRYCSEPCRRAAWYRMSRACANRARDARLASRTCRQCGKPISPGVEPRRRYCSKPCRRAASRAQSLSYYYRNRPEPAPAAAAS